MVGKTFIGVAQGRVSIQQSQYRLLSLDPGQVRTQTQVSTSAKGLVMGVFPAYVKAIRISIDRRVAVCPCQRNTQGFTFGDRTTGQANIAIGDSS